MGTGHAISFNPIGIIHSPYRESRDTPIQPIAARRTEGRVEVFESYAEGLEDLVGFSHIILLYHFHLARHPSLKVVPFMDDTQRGVFSTRAPNRPNPIGISVVDLVRIERQLIHIKGIDILDETPLLDIKPFVPQIDHRERTRIGWLQNNIQKLSILKDDGRFNN